MSHTTEQPVLEPSNPQGLRIGDICSYSFGERTDPTQLLRLSGSWITHMELRK